MICESSDPISIYRFTWNGGCFIVEGVNFALAFVQINRFFHLLYNLIQFNKIKYTWFLLINNYIIEFNDKTYMHVTSKK